VLARALPTELLIRYVDALVGALAAGVVPGAAQHARLLARRAASALADITGLGLIQKPAAAAIALNPLGLLALAGTIRLALPPGAAAAAAAPPAGLAGALVPRAHPALPPPPGAAAAAAAAAAAPAAADCCIALGNAAAVDGGALLPLAALVAASVLPALVQAALQPQLPAVREEAFSALANLVRGRCAKAWQKHGGCRGSRFPGSRLQGKLPHRRRHAPPPPLPR
jgi:hypothetical protein